jgi:hypothetical protein
MPTRATLHNMFGYERTLRTLHEMLKPAARAVPRDRATQCRANRGEGFSAAGCPQGRLIIKPRLHHHAKADLDMDQTWWHHESLSLRIGYLKLRPNHSMETGEPAFGKVKWFSNGGRDRVFSLAMLRSDRAYRPEQWEVEWFAAKKPVIDAILLGHGPPDEDARRTRHGSEVPLRRVGGLAGRGAR